MTRFFGLGMHLSTDFGLWVRIQDYLGSLLYTVHALWHLSQQTRYMKCGNAELHVDSSCHSIGLTGFGNAECIVIAMIRGL